MGKIVHAHLPRFIWTPIISLFAKYYKINLAEAEKPISEYPSLGEFFVRKLKAGVRPLGPARLVHPADSVVTQASPIENGNLIQAKGKTYKVTDFLQDSTAQEKFAGGVFLTYYLCPTDYHRVHSPVTGVIQKITHIPGMLWPVNQWSTDNIEELFSINERVVVEIKTDSGLVEVVFVGATNVGFIEIFCKPEIKGNQLEVYKTKYYNDLNIPVSKGEALGQFRMGSTIVCVYEKSMMPADAQAKLQSLLGSPVKVNSDFID